MEDVRLEAQVGAALRALGWTICAAESCTGGLLLHRVTNIPGSSAYVLGGVVAYANEVKELLLHVRRETMIEYGAVSAETAEEMARGALDIFGTTLAVSITGIAGPGGGSPEKPVGLTYIGLARKDNGVMVQRHFWDGDREGIKQASAGAALQVILEAAAG
ncbi:MAG: CinA family protein [Chloroflexi bacterium]|nr:CinA family protein [Chloroflexota bacterium]